MDMKIPALPNRAHPLATGRMHPGFVRQRERNLSTFLQQVVDLTVNHVPEIQHMLTNAERSSMDQSSIAATTIDPRIPFFMNTVMSFFDLEGHAMAFVFAAPTITRPTASITTTTTSAPSSPTVSFEEHSSMSRSMKRSSSNLKLPVNLGNLDHEPFFSYYDTLRRRKFDIMERYELLQQELHDYESSSTLLSSSISQTMVIASQESDWYQQKFAQMEKLKHQLANLRRRGDVFWIEMDNKAYLLNVTSFSHIYISIPSSYENGISIDISKPHQASSPPPPDHCKMIIPIDRVTGITPIQNTYKGDGWEAVVLELKNPDQSIVFYAIERFELTELLGVHLRSYNTGRRKLVSHVKQLIAFKRTRYDSTNEQHETLLSQLWNILMPHEPLHARISKQWSIIGFQGDDPATDFRGFGLLGLQMLLYMAQNYTHLVQNIIRADRGYPFCVSGIQVLSMLFGMLHLDRGRAQDDVESVHTSATLAFLTRMQHIPSPVADIEDDHWTGQREHPFEELFCLACLLLDKVWQEMNGSYMMYPEVIAETKKRLSDAIESPTARAATHFNQLYRQLMGPAFSEYLAREDPGMPLVICWK